MLLYYSLFKFKEEFCMPTNKKEGIIFTITMCALMVFFMSLYNEILHNGIQSHLLINTCIGFIPGFIVALLLDIFLVGPNAKKVAFKLPINKEKQLHKIFAIPGCMVCGMVLCMSVFGMVMQHNFSDHILMQYFKTVLTNAICAFPLQFFIVGPISRNILKTIQAKSIA